MHIYLGGPQCNLSSKLRVACDSTCKHRGDDLWFVKVKSIKLFMLREYINLSPLCASHGQRCVPLIFSACVGVNNSQQPPKLQSVSKLWQIGADLFGSGMK